MIGGSEGGGELMCLLLGVGWILGGMVDLVAGWVG